MKNIILTLFLIAFSCKEKDNLTEKKIFFSNLTEPQKNIYIELLYYYPAKDKKQSNFYLVKDIHTNDTLYVVDKDSLPVSDFIKNYNGIENTAIVLRKGKLKNKNEYLLNVPSNYNLSNKKLYLGELIRIID
ncbi:hypothetical protein [Chryseobacterium sp. W4I1]|uniref:hypothetical protein n=1 Tax=Chryseobacterium sp. W4I1 TaxID=3042293 RepID=UPI00277D2D52|nr:hypothetical protein [Chryseobacterium sp. W4I1]MDQ0781333.1 hypothetical protein [Chryseobacterium sp. W4I1]